MKRVTIILEGVESPISPEDVPAGELGMYLVDLEAAILETAAHCGVDLRGEAFLTFERTKRGSSKAICRTTDQANPYSQRIFDALNSREFDMLPLEATAALRRASERAKAMGRTLHFQAHGRKLRAALVDIPKPPRVDASFVRGATTLYGQVTRIHADTETAVFVTHADAKISLVEVSRSLARELGACLLQDVELSATAFWDAVTFALVKVKPLAVVPHQQDFGRAMTALRSSSADLAGVNVQQALDDLRGEQ